MGKRKWLRKLTQPISSLILLVVLSGCGAVAHKINLLPDYSPVSGTTFEVGKVTNDTGQAFEVNIEQLLTDALTNKLRSNNMLWTDGQPHKVVLACKIVEYDEGNAFKRWLLPGWGATVLSIQCDMKKGEQLVGSNDARRTVSAGGGYTIGAWRTIFENLAEDVVEDLRSKLPQGSI